MLEAFCIVLKYIDQGDRGKLMTAFRISQFTYCPLMHHVRTLWLVYDDNVCLSFEEMLITKIINNHSFKEYEN